MARGPTLGRLEAAGCGHEARCYSLGPNVCGRFTLTTRDFERIASAFEAEPLAGADLQRCVGRFNIAPTQMALMVWEQDGRRVLGDARWGFVRQGDAKPGLLINARSETAHERRAFSAAFAAHRGVIVADGFYEWTGPKGARVPHWFHRPHPPEQPPGLFGLAALVRPALGEEDVRFCLLTREATTWMQQFHDRMPVMLPPRLTGAWLDTRRDVPRQTMLPLTEFVVSTRVNRGEEDDPSLLAPKPPSPLQGELFGDA
jgi:Uncharacterized conserved protein